MCVCVYVCVCIWAKEAAFEYLHLPLVWSKPILCVFVCLCVVDVCVCVFVYVCLFVCVCLHRRRK